MHRKKQNNCTKCQNTFFLVNSQMDWFCKTSTYVGLKGVGLWCSSIQSHSSLSKIFYVQKWRRQRKIHLTNMKINWKDSYQVGSGSISVQCALELSPLAQEWRPSAYGWSLPTRWGRPSARRWSPSACYWSPSAHGWINSALNQRNCLIKDRQPFFDRLKNCNVKKIYIK